MRPFPRPNTSLVRKAHGSAVRFQPVMHLIAGDSLGLLADEPVEFEERVSFGPASNDNDPLSAGKWLAARLERVASAASADSLSHRPILVAAPMAALADPDTALLCDNAVRRTILCQQEFCLMFSDAAFAGDPADSTARIARLRRVGFRVGIDMRRSWQTPLSESLRILIDTIRIEADALEMSAELCDVTLAARASGILVVADHASWRDGEFLEDFGVAGGVAPQSDA
ncbi:MAG: EAL domain-containing protein [Hyphomonas sp.]|uniref:hypothetical protein n=1 Tax=Hyphomonas sp. TaxID=87 RepID=UPI0017EEFABB|nr:hypothetical protein [Hyphomonas sp.]MBA3067462.1 EAL domain-containing protein [Hyphomonas sp.]MBU3919993.1 EAL domain-containing protein [Alphaproteobacteria bacterium]MBU4063350.1 EAL domain-containing protein [Alphaproteobacteria bacterium]MBU4165170.1 EAL domain-containing protein [Alphaproteobacteria bacterium]